MNEVKQKFETQLQKEIEEKNRILTDQINKIETLERYFLLLYLKHKGK